MKQFEEGREISFEEARKSVERNSKYFKPEPGRDYKLTFSKSKLVEKPVLKYGREAANATDADYETKPVLELRVETLNGVNVDQSWDIIQWKLIELFQPYLEGTSIITGKFSFKRTGTGKTTKYTLARVGEKQSPASQAAQGFLFDADNPELTR